MKFLIEISGKVKDERPKVKAFFCKWLYFSAKISGCQRAHRCRQPNLTLVNALFCLLPFAFHLLPHRSSVIKE